MGRTHMDYLEEVARQDVAQLREKEKSYGSSWKKRGGVGAFMMLARKWDRMETALAPSATHPEIANGATPDRPVAPWDVIGAVLADRRDEGLIDDIRDLRRYLLLVEAEILRTIGFGLSDKEDTETKAMAHFSRTNHPAPFGYSEAEESGLCADKRFPRRLTPSQFDKLHGMTVLWGKMAQVPVQSLYALDHRSGERVMHDRFVDEYAQHV